MAIDKKFINQFVNVTQKAALASSYFNANFPNPFIVTSSANPMIIDFWTTNGGVSLFAQSHGVFT